MFPSPIMPKARWRYQMFNMYPDSARCHPLGRSVMRWEIRPQYAGQQEELRLPAVAQA